MNAPHQDESERLGLTDIREPELDHCWRQILDACFAAASSMSVGVLLVNEQLRCVRVNAGLAELSGLPQDEHPGQLLREVLPAFSMLEQVCQQVLETGEAVTDYEIEYEIQSGSSTLPETRRYWTIACFAVAHTRLVSIFMLETTSIKQLEQALHSTKVRFRALVQNSYDMINLETLRQQFERERLINKIAMRVLQTLDLQDILDTAVTEVREFLQADRVIIGRCVSEEVHVVVAEAIGEGWRSGLGNTVKHSWFKQYLNLEQNHIKAVTDDLSTLPLPKETQKWATLWQIRSHLAMPIAFGDQLWGVLAVHQCAEVRHWETFEVELLDKLATQLAIAIQQSELHQQIQHLNDDLENQVEARTAELQVAFEFEATLKRITDRVRDSLDEDQILQAAVRELVLVLKISGCNASMYDLDQRTSTTCYEYTTSISPYQGRVAKFSAAPELYSQLLSGQYFQFCSLVPNPERGLVSMLACPIRDDQGIIGDLWLIHHKEYAFNQQDIRLVEQVANQCAIAIRQARLYKKSQAQVKELERLNQLKDDFLSTVSHELRTPLSNIKMAIHMLKAAPNSEKRERYMGILEAECSREIELINDLLDLQKLENDSYTVAIEPLNLKAWLPSVIAPFLSRANTRQQFLNVEIPDKLPSLMSDRKTLERILAELLNNACKYTPPNGTIALQVIYQPNSSANSIPITTFAVKNQATVPMTEIPRMFEKFYRIPKADPWQQGGTGLGLALVKKLVETLEGNISANSKDGWTTLWVELPMPIGELGIGEQESEVGG
jgi:GAF domain-containing protein